MASCSNIAPDAEALSGHEKDAAANAPATSPAPSAGNTASSAFGSSLSASISSVRAGIAKGESELSQVGSKIDALFQVGDSDADGDEADDADAIADVQGFVPESTSEAAMAGAAAAAAKSTGVRRPGKGLYADQDHGEATQVECINQWVDDFRTCVRTLTTTTASGLNGAIGDCRKEASLVDGTCNGDAELVSKLDFVLQFPLSSMHSRDPTGSANLPTPPQLPTADASSTAPSNRSAGGQSLVRPADRGPSPETHPNVADRASASGTSQSADAATTQHPTPMRALIHHVDWPSSPGVTPAGH